METVNFCVCNGEVGFNCCIRSVCIEVDVPYEFVVYYFIKRIDDQTMEPFFKLGKICVGFYVVRVSSRNCLDDFYGLYVDLERYSFKDVVQILFKRISGGCCDKVLKLSLI